MIEFGGRLMEIDRRDISPTTIYYCAVREPMQAKFLTKQYVDVSIAKREVWRCHSVPQGKDGFAVFVFDGIE